MGLGGGNLQGSLHKEFLDIDDDFWQVVRHEKLGEGDFEVESSLSFGGSQWRRPMSMDTHRSTDHSRHRSTSSAESTAECSAV
ncbi:hypothetical protein F2Q68_00039887 [Brassica cretica]|uniref:Uncharacterized protein n=1 Tax=Brassica cretica TaxID=69181 RepID=A0A8S9MG70_BRACR|nr:hypothetical protein F2Q68_00039887 [Brassica cretica]